MSANHVEALAKALYENGNPQHTAADRAMLGPFEALDAMEQTIWIDLANAAHNHIGEQIAPVLKDFDWHIQNASNGAVFAAEAEDGQSLISWQNEMCIYQRAARLLRTAVEGA